MLLLDYDAERMFKMTFLRIIIIAFFFEEDLMALYQTSFSLWNQQKKTPILINKVLANSILILDLETKRGFVCFCLFFHEEDPFEQLNLSYFARLFAAIPKSKRTDLWNRKENCIQKERVVKAFSKVKINPVFTSRSNLKNCQDKNYKIQDTKTDEL